MIFLLPAIVYWIISFDRTGKTIVLFNFVDMVLVVEMLLFNEVREIERPAIVSLKLTPPYVSLAAVKDSTAVRYAAIVIMTYVNKTPE